jgi:hypothetical protein
LFRVQQFQFSENFDDNNISSGERILRTERETMGRMYGMTDEEELEEEISMGLNTEKIQFLTSNSEVVIPMPKDTSEYRPKKPRLPRGEAGLLRSLSETPDFEEGGNSSNEALIPKSNIGNSSGRSGYSGSGARGGASKRVGDDILDIN